MTAKEQATELRYLAKIIGTTYYKHNDEVTFDGDVRLLDEKNKLLGIYSVPEAKKKCEDLKLDFLLINPNTKPVVCKALDYKQELYRKFTKDVFEKDLPKINKEIQKRNEMAKSIKLGSKMTIADLKNKVVSAQAAAKQSKNLRIYMQVTDATEASGKNILYTFRDLSKDFLVPKGEIEEHEVGQEEEEGEEHSWKKDIEEGEEKIILSQTFHSLLYTGEVAAIATKTIQEYTEEDIEKVIKDYVRAEMRKSSALAGAVNFLKGKDSDFMSLVDETRGDQDVSKGRDRILDADDIETQGGFVGLLQKNRMQGNAQVPDSFWTGEEETKDEAEDFFENYVREAQNRRTTKLKIDTLRNSLEYKSRR